jgi:hypothetical protein
VYFVFVFPTVLSVFALMYQKLGKKSCGFLIVLSLMCSTPSRVLMQQIPFDLWGIFVFRLLTI